MSRRFPSALLPVLLLHFGGALGRAQDFATDVDNKMNFILSTYSVPGGAIAVTYEGRLIYARGYGVADQTAVPAVPVTPTTLFRTASLSKPVTALAIMKLVEQGVLNLDERVATILSNLPPIGTPDARLADVTVRQLLQHTSGLRGQVDDPMFAANFTPVDNSQIPSSLSAQISAAAGDPRPVECASIIRHQFGQTLMANPGAAYAYSNLGYCVLGRIIEAKTGKSYERFVREALLGPAAIQRMQTGRTRLSDRVPGETRYHQPVLDEARSVFPPHDPVARPYGGFYLESFDSLGGWLAGAVDLGRIVARIDHMVGEPIVSAASLAQMAAAPSPVPIRISALPLGTHYGLGFEVTPSTIEPLRRVLAHQGSFPGTRTFLTSLPGRLGLAVAFNLRHPLGSVLNTQMISTEVATDLVNILIAHRIAMTLPTGDLFPTYFRPVVTGATSAAWTNWNRVAPGMHVRIAGQNLGPASRRLPPAGTLPGSFEGIRVRIGSIDAPIRYISANEIGAVVPFATPSGNAALTVHSGGEVSQLVDLQVTRREVTLYATSPASGGTTLADVVKQDGGRHSAANPLIPGETVAVTITGAGSTTPASSDGAITPVSSCFGATLTGWGFGCLNGSTLFLPPTPSEPVTATIGGVSAPVVYARNAPRAAAGQVLVLLTVPQVPKGAAPILVSVGRSVSQPGISVVMR